ncbi:MAG: hypothetical protein H0W84_09000 [Bacteroidetes bacterium]|nr:hypothetical protein [Bacteroidota bacterium]
MKQLFSFILLLISLNTFSQNDSVAYSRDYEFNEGIFLTIDQFKSNDPVPRSAIISNIPKNQLDFLSQLMRLKNIVYKDATGNVQRVERSSIWGYCQNRTIYLNFTDEFDRLSVIGRIGHFTASVKTSVAFSDPMGANTTYDELRQFILDVETNKILDFNGKNMETLLVRDADLYKQFMALKKREKADAIFIYLRRYNEKHPLYLPAN